MRGESRAQAKHRNNLEWKKNVLILSSLTRTCMALLPSLTTSNRVTGSPPSPLCWATPLALPRPRATLTTLSAGDFRGFLLADCAVNRDVVGENKGAKKKKNSEKGRRENQSCNRKQTLPTVTAKQAFEKNKPAHTRACFPGRPLFFLPLISVSSSSLMFMLKPTASVAPDSLDESLGEERVTRRHPTKLFNLWSNGVVSTHCSTGSSEVIILPTWGCVAWRGSLFYLGGRDVSGVAAQR